MLDKLSVATLKKIIQQYNIKGYSKLSKQELIDVIHSRITYEDGELRIKPNDMEMPKVAKRVYKKKVPIKKEEENKEVKNNEENKVNELDLEEEWKKLFGGRYF